MWVNCFLSISAASSVLEEFRVKHIENGLPKFSAGVPMPAFSSDAELIDSWGCPGIASDLPGYVKETPRSDELGYCEDPKNTSRYSFWVPQGPPIPWFLAVAHGLPRGTGAVLGYYSRATSTCGLLRCLGNTVHREEDEGDALLVERFILNYFERSPT